MTSKLQIILTIIAFASVFTILGCQAKEMLDEVKKVRNKNARKRA